MKQICKFKKAQDLVRHKPNLTIDVSQVMETHAIPATGGFDTDFANVDDISQVGERITNNFDVIEAGININNSMSEFQSGTGNNTVASSDIVDPSSSTE